MKDHASVAQKVESSHRAAGRLKARAHCDSKTTSLPKLPGTSKPSLPKETSKVDMAKVKPIGKSSYKSPYSSAKGTPKRSDTEKATTPD